LNFHPQKKEEDIGLVTPEDTKPLENSHQNEKLPEFDEFGTALNDI